MTQPSLFDGATYEPKRDGSRLGEQMQAVKALMSDCGWRTLAEIGSACGAPEASVSARLRDLRKPRWGGFDVQRRYISHGQWAYRVCPP